MRLVWVVIPLLLIGIIIIPESYACSCETSTIEESFEYADIVFSGNAVNTVYVDGIYKTNFVVTDKWKNIGHELIQVKATSNDGNICGINFPPNEKYIVFAKFVSPEDESSKTGLYTGACSNTQLMEQIEPYELSFLQNNQQNVNSIYGGELIPYLISGIGFVVGIIGFITLFTKWRKINIKFKFLIIIIIIIFLIILFGFYGIFTIYDYTSLPMESYRNSSLTKQGSSNVTVTITKDLQHDVLGHDGLSDIFIEFFDPITNEYQENVDYGIQITTWFGTLLEYKPGNVAEKGYVDKHFSFHLITNYELTVFVRDIDGNRMPADSVTFTLPPSVYYLRSHNVVSDMNDEIQEIAESLIEIP